MNACNATLMLQSNERSDPVSGLAFGGGGDPCLYIWLQENTLSLFLRPGWCQHSKYADLCIPHPYVEEIYEKTVSWRRPAAGIASYPGSQSRHRPIQWCFLELFVIFVYKREKKTCSKMTWMNVFLFMYMEKMWYGGVWTVLVKTGGAS